MLRLKVSGSAKIIKPPVEVSGGANGKFVKWTAVYSESTGKKGEDGKTIFNDTFLACECYVNNDDKGSQAKELVLPKMVNQSIMYFNDASISTEDYMTKPKDGSAPEKRTIVKVKFGSLYSLDIVGGTPKVAAVADEDDDSDAPF